MIDFDFEWKREFLVARSSPQNPNSVRVTSLDNGGFVVVFEDGTQPVFFQDRDVLAVVYDRFGNVETPIFRASTASSGRIEVNPEVAAIPGGFAIVYEGVVQNSTSRDLFFQTFTNGGTALNSGTIPLANRPDFNDGGDLRFGDYDVTGLSNGSIVVTYEREIDEGGFVTNDFDDIVANVITASGSVGPQQQIRRDPDDADNAPGETSRPSVTTLESGAIVTAFNQTVGNDTEVAFVVSTVSGTSLSNTSFRQVTNNTTDEARPSVAALSDGGFVVSWVVSSTNDLVQFQVFEANGSPRSGIVTAFSGDVPFANPIFSFGAIVEPLADGGFALLIDNDSANTIFWRAYNADGTLRVNNVEIYDSFRLAENIGLAVTDDGRIVTVYKETSGGNGDIYASIWDPRANPVTPLAATTGNDIITLQNDAAPTVSGDQGGVVNALSGNDTVFGGRSNDTIEGGQGRDSLIGGQGDDSIDGAGVGILETSNGEDTIIGGAGNDIAFGGGDDDILYGEGTFIEGLNWVLNPNNGHYYAVVIDPGVTWLEATEAADQLGTGVHLASITSQSENDFISTIAPAGGALIGGFQDRTAPEPSGGFRWTSGETFSYENWLSGRPDNAGGSASNNTENAIELTAASDSNGRVWDDIADNVARNAYILEIDGADDTLFGEDGADLLIGGLGDDSLVGGGNSRPFGAGDTLLGGSGDDTLDAGEGGTATGGAGRDVFQFLSGGGTRTVTDFTVGEDLFDVSAIGVRSVNGIIFNPTSISAGGTAYNLGFNSSVLSASDFIFAPSVPDLVVDTLTISNDGITTPGNLDLVEALGLIAPGGTITFASNLSGGTITSPISINERVTIDGDLDDDGRPDITIDVGRANTRPLFIGFTADGTVIDGLRLINGNLDSGRGGGLSTFSDVTIKNSEIADNTSDSRFTNVSGHGGGIYAATADVVIENTRITGNRAEDRSEGGGIYVVDGSLTLRSVLIDDNLSFEPGGGVSLVNSIGIFEDTTIYQNRAIDNGGGISVSGGSLTTTNLTLAENEGRTIGSALFAENAPVTLKNATVTGNFFTSSTSPTRGGPIDINGTSSFTIANSIVLGNTIGPAGSSLTLDAGVPLTVGGLNIIGTGTDTDASDGIINGDVVEVFDNTRVVDGVLAGATFFVNGGALAVARLEGSAQNDALDASFGPDVPTQDALGIEAVDLPFVGFSNTGAQARDLGAAERTSLSALIPNQSTDEDTPIEIDALALLAGRGFDTAGYVLTRVEAPFSDGLFSVTPAGTLLYDPNFQFEGLSEGQNGGFENFSFFAVGPDGGEARGGGGVQIFGRSEGPATVAIAADNASIDEGDSPNQPVSFTITRSGNLGLSFTVDLTLTGNADGATLGTSSVNFAPGEQTKPVIVSFDGDTQIEDTEQIGVKISVTSPLVTVSKARASTSLLNDDFAPTAVDDAFAVGRGEVLSGSLFDQNGPGSATDETGQVIFADADPDGDPFTLKRVKDADDVGTNVNSPQTEIVLPSGAILTVSPNGSFSLDTNPVPLIETEIAFTYTIEDGTGAKDRGTVVVDLVNTVVTPATEGPDVILGTPGADLIEALGGNDSVLADASNDTIDGGAGRDTLVGGLGDDTYLIDNSRDRAVEERREGTDTVVTTVNYRLPDNIEKLILFGSATDNLVGRGNDEDNTITGDAGDNTLIGGGGSDTINGGAGADNISGRSGADELMGGTENDMIDGQAGADIIDGGAGDDSILGGRGSDTLTGGSGSDIFKFNDDYGRNDITDFTVGVDRINLRDVREENAGARLTFDQLLIRSVNGSTDARIELDLDRDGIADTIDLNEDGLADVNQIDLLNVIAGDLSGSDFAL